jgi:hypothetical protein
MLRALKPFIFTISFRGLDPHYALSSTGINALREIISCRAAVPHAEVRLEAITILNETLPVQPDHEGNLANMSYYSNCKLINTLHWDMKEPINSRLKAELLAEEPVHFHLSLPIPEKRAYGANIINFLITSINEHYADLLVSDYMAFFVGPGTPAVVNHIPFAGIFGQNEYNILMYMFILQIIIIIAGNYILSCAKSVKIPLPRYNNPK